MAMFEGLWIGNRNQPTIGLIGIKNNVEGSLPKLAVQKGVEAAGIRAKKNKRKKRREKWKKRILMKEIILAGAVEKQ